MNNKLTPQEIDNAEPVLFVELDELSAGFSTREYEIKAEDLLALQEQIAAFDQLLQQNASQQGLLAVSLLLKTTVQHLIQIMQAQDMKGLAALLEKFGMFAVTHETQELRNKATQQKQHIADLTKSLPPAFRT